MSSDGREEDATRRLGEKGFRIASATEESSFGDRAAVWERGALRLRLSRDRGQEFIDVGSTAEDEWYDLGLALSAAGVEGDPFRALTRFEDELALLDAHLDALARAFSRERFPQTRQALKELEIRKVRALFPNLRVAPPGD